MHQKKSLVLLTDFFPFGAYEPYLKHELKFLPDYFEEILILSATRRSVKPIYPLAPNVAASQLHGPLAVLDKILSLRFFFTGIFWQEWNTINRQYGLRVTLDIIKVMLVYLQQASVFEKILSQELSRRGLMNENLILYSFWSDFRAMAIARLAQRGGMKAVTRAHGWDVYFERHEPPYLPFRKFLADHLNACFFVSDDGMKYTAEKLGEPGNPRLQVARLGTEYCDMNPEMEEHEFIIVSCARIIPLKRVHLMADILKHLPFPVRWIHFGDGIGRAEVEVYTRERLAACAHIQVEWRGEMDNASLLAFYAGRHVDLFMLTSEFEGMPMVIMEAMSFGIPVMATDVGGINEMVDEQNGFLLPKNFDPAAAAEIIEKFRGQPSSFRQAFRKAAAETWRQKFNAATNYKRFAGQLLLLSEK